ncbi:MAG TPA: MFS transporter [Acidimicrobiales bacterium]|nr:MFS transporter [Acidimicrobiales bacterium]
MALVDSTGTGMFLATSVVFFTRKVGLSTEQVGAGLSISGALGLAGTLPLGHLADRLGAKAATVLVNIWRFGAFLVYPFVHTWSEFVLVACFIAVPNMAAPSLSQALVGAAIGPERRVRTMALIRALRNVGYSLGGLAATGALAWDSKSGYQALIVVDAVTFLFTGLMALGVPVAVSSDGRPRTVDLAARAPAPVGTSARRRVALRASGPLTDAPFAMLSLTNAVLLVHMTLLSIGIPLWVTEHTKSPRAVVGALFVINTVGAALFQVRASRGAGTPEGAARLLRKAGTALGVECLLLAWAPSLGALLATAVLVAAIVAHTGGELFQSAGGWELSFSLARKGQEARYISTFNLGMSAQQVLGPLLITFVAANGAVAWGVVATAVVLAGLCAVPLARWASTGRLVLHEPGAAFSD